MGTRVSPCLILGRQQLLQHPDRLVAVLKLSDLVGLQLAPGRRVIENKSSCS